MTLVFILVPMFITGLVFAHTSRWEGQKQYEEGFNVGFEEGRKHALEQQDSDEKQYVFDSIEEEGDQANESSISVGARYVQ